MPSSDHLFKRLQILQLFASWAEWNAKISFLPNFEKDCYIDPCTIGFDSNNA